MTHIGIDIAQFTQDPYGSGIQRVLQQLALHWPSGGMQASFLVPRGDSLIALDPEQAVELLGLPFGERPLDQGDLAEQVRRYCETVDGLEMSLTTALSVFDVWMLPEVSYSESVLTRFRMFAQCMPTFMIGYDALPMTHPENYRFVPGNEWLVSEYFRSLIVSDAVVCISEQSRWDIWERLRRSRSLPTTVAPPGGDHIPVLSPQGKVGPDRPVRFLRVGTIEERKRPLQILRTFLKARESGAEAELIFVGRPSASDASINDEIRRHAHADSGVTWIEIANDDDVHRWMADSDIFLSIGTEGFGIPVLESIRLGTPVLFSGIQPAADLMENLGAIRVAGEEHHELVSMFQHYSDRAELETLVATLDPDSVPTWRGFVDGVVAAVPRS